MDWGPHARWAIEVVGRIRRVPMSTATRNRLGTKTQAHWRQVPHRSRRHYAAYDPAHLDAGMGRRPMLRGPYALERRTQSVPHASRIREGWGTRAGHFRQPRLAKLGGLTAISAPHPKKVLCRPVTASPKDGSQYQSSHHRRPEKDYPPHQEASAVSGQLPCDHAPQRPNQSSPGADPCQVPRFCSPDENKAPPVAPQGARELLCPSQSVRLTPLLSCLCSGNPPPDGAIG